VVINLFARTYLPNEEVLQPGDPVDGIMFIMEGHMAVCEPNGEPFCIFGEGSFLGDFQVLKNIPWFFLLKVIHHSKFETSMERDNGDLRWVATGTDTENND
jgi:CRP-like cAMP-binding protein